MTKKLAALVCGIALVSGCATITQEQLKVPRTKPNV